VQLRRVIAVRSSDDEMSMCVCSGHRAHQPWMPFAMFGRAECEDEAAVEQRCNVGDWGWSRIGECDRWGRPKMNGADAVGVEQRPRALCGGFRRGVNPRPSVDGTTQDSAGAGHVGVGLTRVFEEPTVVHGDHRGPLGGRSGVVRAVHHINIAQPSIGTGSVDSRPDAGRGTRRQWKADLPWLGVCAITQQVAGGRHAVVRAEVIDDVSHSVADTGAVSVEGSNVDGDAHQVGIMPARACRWVASPDDAGFGDGDYWSGWSAFGWVASW